MPRPHTAPDRGALLADVAEMYYLQDKGQAEIADVIGVTRSMVSRMLKEARQMGIVETRVHRKLQPEVELETALTDCFDLKAAYVVAFQRSSSELIRSYLGAAGVEMLERYLIPGGIIGISWGAAVSAVVNAFRAVKPMELKIVQLVGALGAREVEYDGHALVLQLAQKLGSTGYFLNAPFLCPSVETAASLRQTAGIRETLALAKQAQAALVGIGSSGPKYSGCYLSRFATMQDIEQMQRGGAVGDVCGAHFDIHGRPLSGEFSDRSIAIAPKDLLRIPVRIGVAGGQGKVEPILGALRAGYVNVLVTDAITAQAVLDLGRTQRKD